jgi:hypothetical protein
VTSRVTWGDAMTRPAGSFPYARAYKRSSGITRHHVTVRHPMKAPPCAAANRGGVASKSACREDLRGGRTQSKPAQEDTNGP